MKLKKASNLGGRELSTINRYKIQDHQILLNNKQLVHATEMLFQGNVNGTDLLIIREEYNSRSNPVRILAYWLGHPVQVDVTPLNEPDLA
jgi:hypothetical protein